MRPDALRTFNTEYFTAASIIHVTRRQKPLLNTVMGIRKRCSQNRVA